MPVDSEERNRTVGKFLPWFFAAAVILGSLFYVFYEYPHARVGPRQPIPFSHRVHAGVKQIQCRFCHPFVERSENAGIPEVEKCFFCHKYILPEHPEIRKEKRYYDENRPVPWVRIFYVPDFVKFKHQPHILFGRLDCSECHGPVQGEDRLRKVDFEMGFCIDCHKKRSAQLDCWLACHH